MIVESQKNFGRFYNDFNVGDVYKHWPGKTITESDNNLFCLITMNHHPVHLDKEYVKTHKYEKILVVGTLVLSLAVGLSVKDTSGKAIANLEYTEITHHLPVFVNDTIYVESEVIEKRISKTNPSRGIVFLKTIARNQNSKIILTLKRKILVNKN
jgi:acyl dehydratase